MDKGCIQPVGPIELPHDMGLTKTPPVGPASPSELLSVGKVAKETGISPDTLRIWERRYGCPVPYRLPSGHRRYSIGQTQWLRLVSEALARGMRPSKVLPLEPEELERVLQRDGPQVLDEETSEYMLLLKRFETEELIHRLLLRVGREAPLEFLEGCLSPLLLHVGAEWAAGRLEVRHEHVCSQAVATVLTRARTNSRGVDQRGRALRLVLSTLPDDEHELGLHMVAYLAETKGINIQMLGCDIPSSEIVAAVREWDAHALAISVSMPRGGIQADQQLSRIADELPAGCELVAGGAGTRSGRRSPRGVRLLVSLVEFNRWLEGWIARASRRVS